MPKRSFKQQLASSLYFIWLENYYHITLQTIYGNFSPKGSHFLITKPWCFEWSYRLPDAPAYTLTITNENSAASLQAALGKCLLAVVSATYTLIFDHKNFLWKKRRRKKRKKKNRLYRVFQK